MIDHWTKFLKNQINTLGARRRELMYLFLPVRIEIWTRSRRGIKAEMITHPASQAALLRECKLR